MYVRRSRLLLRRSPHPPTGSRGGPETRCPKTSPFVDSCLTPPNHGGPSRSENTRLHVRLWPRSGLTHALHPDSHFRGLGVKKMKVSRKGKKKFPVLYWNLSPSGLKFREKKKSLIDLERLRNKFSLVLVWKSQQLSKSLTPQCPGDPEFSTNDLGTEHNLSVLSGFPSYLSIVTVKYLSTDSTSHRIGITVSSTYDLDLTSDSVTWEETPSVMSHHQSRTGWRSQVPV